ncbi:MAG: retropepsin-like aspartic protease [Gammaproteobacteria bacterium]
MTGNGQQQTPQRLGKGMIVIAWILLLVLLTWFFNDRLDQQRNPNRQLNSTVSTDSIPMVQLERNRFGHYVATGAINGHPVEFMLDTGATDVSIPATVADKLGLKRGRRVYYQTANGTIAAYQTTLDEIQLGPLRLGPVRASINPNVGTDAILLGMSFLKELDFNQQGNTLTLKYAQPGRP